MANMSGAAASAATPATAAVAAPTTKPAPAPASAAAPASSKPAAVAKAPRPAGGYGVQLGAYSTKAKAEAAWVTAAQHFKAELGSAPHEVVAGKSGAAHVFRLHVAQGSESAARGLCSTLKARHQACIVFHP